MKQFLAPAAAALIACHAHNARADEVTLIAPGGIRAPIQKMIPDFERKTGHTVKAASNCRKALGCSAWTRFCSRQSPGSERWTGMQAGRSRRN